MKGQLPTALGKLHAQLKKTLDEKRVGEVNRARAARRAKEIADVAAMLGATPGIASTDGISTHWLEPMPTHCEACGQSIRTKQ